MSVLKTQFDYKCNQCSPASQDLKRVVEYDEDGNEFISYVPEDYEKIRISNGSVKVWSLNSLLRAGISPDMPIHTGLNTRLEGIGVINDAVASLDDILADSQPIENKEK